MSQKTIDKSLPEAADNAEPAGDRSLARHDSRISGPDTAAVFAGAPQTDHAVPAIQPASKFLSEYWPRLLGVSALLLTPCLWQRRIQAGDLASHVYNAWLAQLIAHGQAPGLSIAPQSNNILFDLLLLHLGNIVGLPFAERIAVCAAVLLFFWGAFALVCAISRQVPWRILPCLAMFSYGWTFQMGFFNYYISLGLAFTALAVLHRGRGKQRALALLLVPLIWMAHPLGFALLLAAGAYLLATEARPIRLQYYCAAAAALVLLFARVYLSGHFAVLYSPSRYIFNGTDQLFTYGARYHLLANALALFLAVVILFDVAIRRRARSPEKHPLLPYSLPLQLYGLVLLAALLLPSLIDMSGIAAAPVSFLTERLTSVSAVLLCCLLATAKPQKWHLAGFAIFAAIFFTFTYQDTATINKMEDRAGQYERALPPGQRITATIFPLAGSRVFINHIVDRACIGQCFSYGNYEPSSQQFRIRAQAGNPIVVADPASSDAIQSGTYVIQPQDLPLYQIFQCDLSMTMLCMRELAAGETNGRIGLHMAHRRLPQQPVQARTRCEAQTDGRYPDPVQVGVMQVTQFLPTFVPGQLGLR